MDPAQPAAGDLVRIRLRTGREDMGGVFLCTDREKRPMEETDWAGSRENGRFRFFEAFLRAGETDSYWFELLTLSGRRVLYGRRGLCRRPGDKDRFRILPGFSVPDWAKGAVMYQIFPDRFASGSRGNQVRTGEYFYNGKRAEYEEDWYRPPAPEDTHRFYGGDLQGVLDHLDYLQDLGVDVLYFNPLFVSPSSHKYDTQDYDHIDPHFGPGGGEEGPLLEEGETDNAEAGLYIRRTTDPACLEKGDALFARLTEEAHRRGMRILLDGVFNHCGSFHRWLDAEGIYRAAGEKRAGAFQSAGSPFRDYFHFEEDAWPGNGSYEGWWGHKTLPKLNYEGSEDLEKEILRIGAKWVSPPFSADGWRLDVAADLGHSEAFNHRFWKRFREAVKGANPEALILAENYAESEKWLRGEEWDSIMNCEGFMEPLTWFLTGMEKHSLEFREDLLNDPRPFWRDMLWKRARNMPAPAAWVSMNQLSNHDHSRFLTRTSGLVGRSADLGPEKASEGIRPAVFREAVLVQMTWPGVPAIYYGDEAGLTGFTDPDDRRTYPWGREDREMLAFHRALIGLRRTFPVLRQGSLVPLFGSRGRIAYGRFDEEEVLIAAVSNLDEPSSMRLQTDLAGLPEEAEADLVFVTDEEGFRMPGEKVRARRGRLALSMAPRSACILHWRRQKPEAGEKA